MYLRKEKRKKHAFFSYIYHNQILTCVLEEKNHEYTDNNETNIENKRTILTSFDTQF